MGPIVDIQLRELDARLAARRITLDVTAAAREWLASHGYDANFGARPLKRLVQREVGDALASALLGGMFTEGDTVTVDANSSGLELHSG
jgi:ATP-dependent Clp protease ATP-binding subunit ClpB